MISHLLKPYLPQVIQIFRNHKIKSAWFFGSALTNSFNEKSDLDVLVNMEDNLDPVEAGEHLWSISDELRDLLKREIDLLTERSIKNPYFKQEIEKTKWLVYGA